MTEAPFRELFETARVHVDCGETEALRALLARHPALLGPGPSDATPPSADNALLLHLANWPGGRPGGAATARLLLEQGADPMLRNSGDGESVLHWAASNQSDQPLIDALLAAGADIDAPGGIIRGGTPLQNALYFGLVEVGDFLVSRGAWQDNIIMAAGLGRIDLLRSWHVGGGRFRRDATRIRPTEVRHGDPLLDDRETRNWCYSAVICALMCHRYDVVDWFIGVGFDIDHIPEEAEWSCLHHAAYRGSLSMAMYLVARGASLEVKSRTHDVTPADYGFAHGHSQVMNYLVDRGTPLTLYTAAGYGRLDHVITGLAGCEDRAALLARTIGTRSPIGKPLHADVLHGRREVARYLLQREPELAHQALGEHTALSLAEELGDERWLEMARRR